MYGFSFQGKLKGGREIEELFFAGCFFFLNLCRSNLTHLCFLVIFQKVRKRCVSVISVLSQGGARVEVQEERGECSPQRHKVM